MSDIGNEVKNKLGGAWNSVSGWFGDKLKQGASWSTRQVTDGVKSAFTGKASPESDNGFEPGAFLGKMFNDAPWYMKILPLLGAVGGFWIADSGPIDKGMGILKGLLLTTVATFALNYFLGDKTKNSFQEAAAHDPSKPVKPDAKINLSSVPGGSKTTDLTGMYATPQAAL